MSPLCLFRLGVRGWLPVEELAIFTEQVPLLHGTVVSPIQITIWPLPFSEKAKTSPGLRSDKDLALISSQSFGLFTM